MNDPTETKRAGRDTTDPIYTATPDEFNNAQPVSPAAARKSRIRWGAAPQVATFDFAAVDTNLGWSEPGAVDDEVDALARNAVALDAVLSAIDDGAVGGSRAKMHHRFINFIAICYLLRPSFIEGGLRPVAEALGMSQEGLRFRAGKMKAALGLVHTETLGEAHLAKLRAAGARRAEINAQRREKRAA